MNYEVILNNIEEIRSILQIRRFKNTERNLNIINVKLFSY